MSQHSSTKLTYKDYLQFPDDGLRHEIIEGEHYVTPSPATRHQRISRNLSHMIQTYLDGHPIGELFYAPFDVLLSEFNILVPDVVFISNERSHFLTSKNLQGAPDLVIEILSPSTKSRDKRLKRDVYERTGVEEYWIVDPDQNIVDVYRRTASSASGVASGFPSKLGAGSRNFADSIRCERTQILNTSLLPGLELPLDKILA